MKIGKPNTNQEVDGKNPRAILRKYAKDRHICDRCRSRWVEANQVFCDICEGRVQAYNKKHRRSLTPQFKRDKNPRWVELILASDQTSRNTVMVSVLSDLGTLLTVKNLEAIDIRNSLKGKAVIQTVNQRKK